MNSSQILTSLFEQWANAPVESMAALPQAGSNRSYYRITGGGKTAVGTFGSDIRENTAFLALGHCLRKNDVAVPEVYAVTDDRLHYLQEDLGGISLFDVLPTPEAPGLLKKAVEDLAYMQVKGLQTVDFASCYPSEVFDRRSICWDLNYFKYDFLKLTTVDFDESLLEDDFERLTSYLLEADRSFFMYRDFQSRNIMVTESGLRYIDFQGGRRGPLAYDLASFLFQGRANFTEAQRNELLGYYLDKLKKLIPVDSDVFITQFYTFAFFRILQTMGTYGYRGLFEKKSIFMQSIPQALSNLNTLIESEKITPLQTDYLFNLIKKLTTHFSSLIPHHRLPVTQPVSTCRDHASLLITIHSFAFKNGYPSDDTGNGGGYVFDCRGLNNPGRVPELNMLTGRDQPVIAWLEQHAKAKEFLHHIFDTLDSTISNYLERGFSNLSVAFGCTGGQHRSVYCAEQAAAYLSEKYKVNICLIHREIGIISRQYPVFRHVQFQ